MPLAAHTHVTSFVDPLPLRMHLSAIYTDSIDMDGGPVLQNIRRMDTKSPAHELCELLLNAVLCAV